MNVLDIVKFPALFIFIFLIVIPLDSTSQLFISLSTIFTMLITLRVYEFNRKLFFRILILALGTYLTVRYLWWRGAYTIYAEDWLSLSLMLLLFAAEFYSATIHILGSIVNVVPLKRPKLKLSDLPKNSKLPTVDILIPSYNEELSILDTTVRAALNMNYPKDKLFVYLLDDGGTDQKINSKDKQAAKGAKERRKELQEYCKKVGATYLTRPKNEHAKAGNLNHALQFVHGDIIAVLDADHVPTVDFLEYTVPWMVKYEDVFLVQTPHFMINPDPIDKNLLQSFRRMPSENDMFYKSIQRGLDFWSASFFCGSAALLRRCHIDEVGGIAGESITEDAETALELHKKGYRSIYVDRPMVAGLSPETFSAFITQRMRWAQGMVQILLLKKPFLSKELSWHQRLGYMSTILFWLFPFARTVFLLTPLAYLYFGLYVYNASFMEIFAYTLPHVIGTYIVSSMLFGRVRWPLISEIYELMQSIFSLMAIVKVFMNPRKPSFVVTPKGDTLDKEFISPLSKPFYVFFVLLLAGFFFGGYRLVTEPMTRDLTLIVVLWNLFNFITVFAAFGALYERKQIRSAPRININENAVLIDKDNKEKYMEIFDISANGCKIYIEEQEGIEKEDKVTVKAYSHALGYDVYLHSVVRAVIDRKKGAMLGLQFVPTSEKEINDSIVFAHGDSARWKHFEHRRLRPISYTRAARMVLSLVWQPALNHKKAVMSKARTYIKNKKIGATNA